MRFDDLAPRQQPSDRIDGNPLPPCPPAFLVAPELGEPGAQDRLAHLAELFGGRAGADRLHQAAHGIQRAFGIVIGKRLVVRELFPDIDQFVHDRAFGASQHGLERVRPEPVHGVEQRGLIPGNIPVGIGLQTVNPLGGFDLPVSGQRAFQAFFDKGDQRVGQDLHALENVLARALGHALLLL